MWPFLQKQISLTWDDSSSNHLQSDNTFFQLKTVLRPRGADAPSWGIWEEEKCHCTAIWPFLNLPCMWPWLFRAHMSNVLHKMLLTKECSVWKKCVEELCYFNDQNLHVRQMIQILNQIKHIQLGFIKLTIKLKNRVFLYFNITFWRQIWILFMSCHLCTRSISISLLNIVRKSWTGKANSVTQISSYLPYEWGK